MKRHSILTCIFISAVFFLAQCTDEKKDDNNNIVPDGAKFGGYESQVKWGEHLVLTGGCGDCHTPKKMTDQGPVDDSSLLLSGHPAQLPIPPVDRVDLQTKGVFATQTLTSWVGPWGVSFSANITSDSTGIGTWNEEQFIYALRNGIYKGLAGSRPLLPPMPWHSIRNFSDDELKAIFAYLKNIKPIKNTVPTFMPPATK
ncbi:MAG TPA: hypothetical protein VJU78_10585 [Chitinophagaceae bacterium]|nr:hypothetical protein [Chitinophagaceae bacterium]